MQLSMWTDATAKVTPEQGLRLIADAGFAAAEFGITHWLAIDAAPAPEQRFESLRRLADEIGVAVPQMHGPFFNLCEPDPTIADDMARTRRSLHYGAILGVKWMVLHPGRAPMGDDPGAADQIMQRNYDMFASLLDTGVETGVGLAIENMSWFTEPTFCGVTEPLIELVDRLNSPQVGVCWDTGHAHLSNLRQGLALEAIGSRLVATHIADNDRTGDRHWLPYRGGVDWDDVMRALRVIQYDGPLNFEVPGETVPMPVELLPSILRHACEVGRHLTKGTP